MPSIHLNYTILSFRGFEIYPLELSSDDTLIQEVLRKVCSERPLSFLGNDLVFWMVRGGNEVLYRTEAHCPFPVERIDSLRSSSVMPVAV